MAELPENVKRAMEQVKMMQAASGEDTPEGKARKLQAQKNKMDSILNDPNRIILYTGTSLCEVSSTPSASDSEWFFPVQILADVMDPQTRALASIVVTGDVRIPTEGKSMDTYETLKEACVADAERSLRLTVMRAASKIPFADLGEHAADFEKEVSSYPQIGINGGDFIIREMCMSRPKSMADLQAEALAAAKRFQEQQAAGAATSPLMKRFCTNCGTPAGISKFCTNCGAKID